MEMKYQADNGLSKKISKAMETNNITFRMLAKDTGVSLAYLYKLTHDMIKFITHEKLLRLAEALRVEPERLLVTSELPGVSILPKNYIEIIHDPKFIPYQIEAVKKFINDHPEFATND